jgi:hypothetical protein
MGKSRMGIRDSQPEDVRRLGDRTTGLFNECNMGGVVTATLSLVIAVTSSCESMHVNE